MPETGGLKLVVTWPETTGATEEAVFQEELDPKQVNKYKPNPQHPEL